MKSPLSLRSKQFALWTLLVISQFFIGCSDTANNDVHQAEETERLPATPRETPKFVNTSSLQTINEVARGDLSRASEYTGIDFAMALLQALPQGYSAESAAAELFEQWQIGRNHNGRGVLYLFIEEDGVLKIEVGYELEGVFPDAFVASFQQTLKDYYMGEYFGDVVSSMIITMMRRAQGESEEATLSSFLGNLPAKTSPPARYLSGGAGVTESQFIRNRTERANRLQLLSDAERANYGADRDVEVVLKRYLESLKRGINDPYLPLLTRGSQFMRIEYPKNAGFQRNAYQDFSGAYTIYKSGEYAAVRFDRPEVMPILFRKDAQGDWLADITKSWAYSQATNDLKHMNPAYGDHAWIFAWPNELHQPEIPPTPKPMDKLLDLETEILRLEKAIEAQPEVAANYFELADIFYFECYWIRDAMRLIERGLEIDPGNNPYRKRYIDFAYRFPDLSRVGEHYAQIFKNDPGDFRILRRYRPFLKRTRPQGYESIIAQTKTVDKKRPLAKFPFYLNNQSGKFSRKSFNFDASQDHLRVTYTFGPAHWHSKYTPRTKFDFYDSKEETTFGFNLIQREKDGSIYIEPFENDENSSGEYSLAPSEPVTLEISWKAGKHFEILVNDTEIIRGAASSTPTGVLIEQRSGSSVLNFE